LQDSNLSSVSKCAYNKVALFSLSKFQYIHSCTNRTKEEMSAGIRPSLEATLASSSWADSCSRYTAW